MTPDGKIRSIQRKRQKRLVIHPAEVVDIMNDGDSENESELTRSAKKPQRKKARMSDEQFMSWVGDLSSVISKCSFKTHFQTFKVTFFDNNRQFYTRFGR